MPRGTLKRHGLCSSIMLGLLALALTGCATSQRRSTTSPELAEWEASLESDLRESVETLASDFASRSVRSPEVLEAAATWLESRLTSMGHDVLSDAFELSHSSGPSVPVRNLVVEVPAIESNDRWLVIGAHFDTVENTPGADDNASGVAGVLALADWFRTRPQRIGLRFELYANEETLFGDLNQRGSARRAQASVDAGDDVVGAIILEMIGYYNDSPPSRTARAFAGQLGVSLPRNNRFLAVASWSTASGLAERISESWRGPVDVVSVLTPVGEPTTVRSDHYAYLQIGVPAVMLTDTAEFRNPNYHGPADTAESLDYASMASAVRSLRSVIEAISTDPTITMGSGAQATVFGEDVALFNGSQETATILVGTRSVTLEPGETAEARLTVGGVVSILEVGSLTVGAETAVFRAERAAPPIRVTVPGEMGAGLYTRGSAADYNRDPEGRLALNIDGVVVHISPRAPSHIDEDQRPLR